MSKFIVVNIATGAREQTYKRYVTHRGAKNFARKLNEYNNAEVFEVASEEFYFDTLAKRTTTVKNLLSGKDVTISLVDLGGCTDPSTERYFSM